MVLMKQKDIHVSQKTPRRVSSKRADVAENQIQSEFVSMIAHQLRTPLSIIKWYAEILECEQAGKLNAHQKKYLHEITVANQRMRDLIETFLDIARIKREAMARKFRLLDIRAISREVIAELEPSIFERRLGVEERYAVDVPYISCDGNLVKIVFQNLLSNAVKYTPEEGSIEVTISSENKGVCFRVQDTGYGIPDADQKQIFRKLFRADNIVENGTEGTGLGLYLVKNILDVTGGCIRFESELGKGSMFEVILPLGESGELLAHSTKER